MISRKLDVLLFQRYYFVRHIEPIIFSGVTLAKFLVRSCWWIYNCLRIFVVTVLCTRDSNTNGFRIRLAFFIGSKNVQIICLVMLYHNCLGTWCVLLAHWLLSFLLRRSSNGIVLCFNWIFPARREVFHIRRSKLFPKIISFLRRFTMSIILWSCCCGCSFLSVSSMALYCLFCIILL